MGMKSRFMVATILVVVVLVVVLSLLFSGFLATWAPISSVNESLSPTASSPIKTAAENMNRTSISKTPIASGEYMYVSIPELNANPSYYENKKIAVAGEFHYIATIPEIRLPYNAVVVANNSQIGVLTTLSVREGAKVVVEGILLKGYRERLGESGWIKDGEAYYILAYKIEQI